MRVVVASCGLDIAPSFSQCENFNYYTTKSFEIVASQNLPAQGLSAEEYVRIMENVDVNALICDEISAASKEAFTSHGIDVMDGVKGNAFQAAETYVAHAAELVLNAAEEEDDE